MAIHHVILWELKEEFRSDEIKAGIKSGLEGLAGKIPGLLRIKVHTGALASSKGADVMLDSIFVDEAALKAYAVNPEHVKVADAFVRPFTAKRTCLDFAAPSELDDLIHFRRSIRRFRPEVPPKELVDAVVQAGLEAPTGRNQESTRILRIDDPALNAKIRAKNAEIMGPPSPGRPADPFYYAPVMLLVIADKSKNPGTNIHDGSLALGNMMLKAHELGLGACWIHRAKEEMESELGAEILAAAHLAGEYVGVGHLALGYSDMPLPAPHIPKPERYIVV